MVAPTFNVLKSQNSISRSIRFYLNSAFTQIDRVPACPNHTSAAEKPAPRCKYEASITGNTVHQKTVYSMPLHQQHAWSTRRQANKREALKERNLASHKGWTAVVLAAVTDAHVRCARSLARTAKDNPRDPPPSPFERRRASRGVSGARGRPEHVDAVSVNRSPANRRGGGGGGSGRGAGAIEGSAVGESRLSSSEQAAAAGGADKFARLRGEGGDVTRVHARNSMNCYRLVAHFIPRVLVRRTR